MIKEDMLLNYESCGWVYLDLAKYKKELNEIIEECDNYNYKEFGYKSERNEKDVLSLNPWGDLKELYEEILVFGNSMLGKLKEIKNG